MKKTKAWVLIISCSILLLVFILFFILITPGILSGKNADMPTKEIISSIIGFTIIISLLIIGLINGLRKIKSSKKKEIIEFKDALEIEFNGQIKFKDYRNLMFNLKYNKPIYLFILGILILSCLSIIFNRQGTINYLLFVTIAVIITSPYFYLKQIKKAYYSNKSLQENINYKINKTSIQIKGSTIDSIVFWKHFQKIKETPHFFILYHQEDLATILEKKMFNKNEIQKFNRFLSSIEINKND